MQKAMQEILLDMLLKRKISEGGITRFEDEESPVDDLRRPKRDEMSQVDTVNYEDLG